MTGGNHLDTVGASQQTREHQRDAHVRLGAAVMFVLWFAFAILNNLWALNVHWTAVAVVSIGAGLLVGYLAYRRGVKITADAKANYVADQKANKAKQLKEFMQNEADNAATESALKNTRYAEAQQNGDLDTWKKP